MRRARVSSAWTPRLPGGGLPSLLVLGLLALAGCSSAKEQPRLLCPGPSIIDTLASFERYRPGAVGQEPGDLLYRAAMENVAGNCTVSGQDLDVALQVEVLIEPGPAFTPGEVEVPYFVAVLSPSGEVLDRQDYVAKITAGAGARRAGSTESFSQRFIGVGRQGGGGYRILFGFGLPRDEALRRRGIS